MAEKKFTPDEIAALYAPFPIEEHNIREGSRNRAKTKIQWFVYADRVAVQKRLDVLFPGEWEFNPLREHRDDKYMSVVAEIVIRGVRRGYNGGGSLNYSGDTFDEDTEKGAMTDTFRRVASLWGIGLYLYDGPQIWTDAYPDGDWNAKRAIEADAKRQFADWYGQRYGQSLIEQAKKNLGPLPRARQRPNAADNDLPTANDIINYVEVRANAQGKPYIVAEGGLTTFTREPFRAAGVDCDDWTTPGEKHMLDKPLLVRYVQKGDYKSIVEVEAET